jgi:hypothetical protein
MSDLSVNLSDELLLELRFLAAENVARVNEL